MRQILSPVGILIFFLLSANLYAQEQIKKITRNGLDIEINKIDQKSDKFINHFIVESPTPPINEASEKRLLVKFKSQPLAKNTTGYSARTRSLERDHSQFLTDIRQLQRAPSSRGNRVLSVLTEYKHVFNGYSIIASPDLEAEIRQLPYVASVVEDKRVQIVDQTSNEIIRADKVWSDYNITGRGVVIGIIDTGIDYTHPDLGGAMGPSHKVIGGYDFVNEDNDPFDDHGHGTHVAGIAAAKGIIKGVAPDAKLVAFKALTSEGWGYDSWILAAIERTVDPDQNPNTNDALDVVNMSLGRVATPDDPFSEAIANATALGVTFVVSAGNTGDYFTVGAPGTAPDAITVGATDQQDIAAWFSSKGPTEFDYQIKPDVSAPGVEINSTFPQNGYTKLNGTSMASPHVAGAVALLLERNPSWTPEIIKAALMNYSKPGTEPDSYWNQGAGRIDILESIQSKFVVTPGSLSLGIYNGAENVEKVFKTRIYNTSTEVKEFSIAVTGDIVNSHVSATVQPAVASISPGQSREIIVTFNTTPGLISKSITEGYFGALVVASDGETIKLPVAMVNLQKTKLIFSTPLPSVVYVMGLNGLSFTKRITPETPEIELLLPAGTLEVVALYGTNTMVIKEALDGSMGGSIMLTQNLAKNRIVFGFKDIDNNLIDIDARIHAGAALVSTQKLLSIYGFPQDTFYVSDNSVAMFDFIARDKFGDKYYDLGAGLTSGLHESVDIIKTANTKFKIRIGDASPHLWEYISTGFHFNKGGVTIRNINPMLSTSDEIELYAAYRSPTDNFAFSKAFITDMGRQNAIETGSFAFYENDLVKFSETESFPNTTTALYDTETFEYTVGASLLRWNGMMVNENDRIALHDNHSIGLFNYALNERKREEVEYQLKSGGQILESGKILNRTYIDPAVFTDIWGKKIDAGLYSLSILSTNHRINASQDVAQVELEFDTRKTDSNPPLLRAFNLEYNGHTTNKLNYGEHATFRIAVTDCRAGYCYQATSGVSSVKFFIKSDGSEWHELELIKLREDTFASDILEPLPQGYYSTKIIAIDYAGNSLTYSLSQAFVIGPPVSSPGDKVTLLEPINHSQNVVRSPLFTWESVDALSYTFQLSKVSTFATLETTVTQSGYELTLPDLLDYNSSYYWRVRANYETESGPWSDIFDFGVPHFQLKLLEPENQSLQSNIAFINYVWEDLEDASMYHIQVSTDPNFRSIEYETGVSDAVYHSPYFPAKNIVYYWRVRPYYRVGYWGGWSQVSSFTGTVILSKVFPFEPFDNSVIYTRQPVVQWTKSSVAESYTVQFSQSADFSVIEAEYETVSDLDPLPEKLDFSGKYYWRVRQNYEEQVGPWSDVSSFTIDEFKLVLLEPAISSFQINISHMNFVWEGIDNVVLYNFQLSPNLDFSSDVYDISVSNSSFTYSFLPVANGVYYWRVRPLYTLNYWGIWSDTFFFTSELDQVSLLSPADQSVLSNFNVDFEWENLGNAAAFTFQMSKDPEFNSIEHETEITDLMYSYSHSMESNFTYYWRVRPYYGLDYYGEWATPFSFTTGLITGLPGTIKEEDKPVAYPNPFSSGTTIKFSTISAVEISFEISNMEGQTVDSFKKFFPLPGKQVLEWKKNDLAPGVYLLKIISADKNDVLKLIRK